jgi:uncharacterized membrane protein YqjE
VSRSQKVIDEAVDLGAQLLRMAHTRLEILGVELQREKATLARQLSLAVACGVSAALGAFAAILWVALAFPPEWRFWVLGGLTLAFIVTAVVCALLLRKASRNREMLFGRLADVLRRDGEALEQRNTDTHADDRPGPGTSRDPA